MKTNTRGNELIRGSTASRVFIRLGHRARLVSCSRLFPTVRCNFLSTRPTRRRKKILAFRWMVCCPRCFRKRRFSSSYPTCDPSLTLYPVVTVWKPCFGFVKHTHETTQESTDVINYFGGKFHLGNVLHKLC